MFTSIWGEDQTGSSQTKLAIAVPGEKITERSLAHPFFANDLPLRLCLLGLAIGIQGYDELPIALLIGRPVAAVLSFLAMALSLVFICLAISPRLPDRLVGKAGLLVGKIAVIGCLILGGIGLGYVGLISFEMVQSPVYYNDGTLLDHNAALLVLHGQNPYTQSDIVAAIRNFHQPAVYTTPLQQGKLANQLTYPTNEQLQALLALEPIGHPDQVLEFESHVSYPALAFLVLIPLVWAGAPTVVPFYLLCLALLALIGLRFVQRELRWWVALLFLADLPVLNSTLSGSLDLFYILLIFLAWLSYRRWWLSATLLGLALASKQISWYYFPFYLIFIYQRYGVRDAVRRFMLASVLFVALNLPFLALNAGAWSAGVLAPMRDPMFPEGAGLIALSIGNLVPFLPREGYALLEGLGMVGALLWYWRWGRVRPESAMVLAVLPLFLAWRSLPSYFYFCALPTALLLAQANSFTNRTIAMSRTKARF
jgi:uncharacterized membrane protein